jgi:hypothetical protein
MYTQYSHTLENNNEVLNPNEKHVLIDGTFSAHDAKDILLSLINSKIKYHQLKNFSSEERFGKKDRHSEERIVQLSNTRQQLLELFERAETEKAQLKIHSLINIEFV